MRHQHLGEDPFLNSEQQENKHTAPLLFCRPFAESVWLCSAFKKSALRAHTVAIEAKKHNTRFKQERLCVLCFPFLFLFGSGSVHILYSYERTEDKIQALQQFTNKSGSVFHFPVWFWFC